MNKEEEHWRNLYYRHKARLATKHAVKMGKLVRGSCEACGTMQNIEAHHEDYEKPLNVMWLCRTHHRALHVHKREIMKGFKQKEKVSFLLRITPDQAAKLKAIAEKQTGGNVTRYILNKLSL